MNREEITHYSRHLDRGMHIMIYGQGGIPFLSFPTQDSMYHNYHDFLSDIKKMMEVDRRIMYIKDEIEKRKEQLDSLII